MCRRLVLAGALAILVALVAVPGEAAASGASAQTGTFTFPAGTTTCVAFTDVGFVVCGVGGTIEYHLLFTPSGDENSWFMVQGFTGTVTQLCATYPFCPSMSFAGDSATVLVHLGPDRPDFILVNHPSTPLPHQVPLP